MQKINPECPICNGTGWIWSTTIVGKRYLCYNCNGTGEINSP